MTMPHSLVPNSLSSLKITIAVAAMVATSPMGRALAQFESGSDGSYGELKVATGKIVELEMPPDGIFHCTTITIEESAQITFS